METVKRLCLVSFAIIVATSIMACVSFSDCKRKKLSFKNYSLKKDTLLFVPFIVKKSVVIDLVKKDTSFEIEETLPPLNVEDSYAIDSILQKELSSQTLSFSKALNVYYSFCQYSPDIFIEGFVKGKSKIIPYYNIYIDSKSNKYHVSFNKNGIYYVSDILSPTDHLGLDSIISIITKESYSMNKSQNVLVDKTEGFVTPSMINDNPMYFKDRTSDYVFDAISSWQLTDIMLLNPLDDEGEHVRGYKIVSKLNNITNTNAADLCGLLLNSSSYKQGNIVKNATFLPDFACRFSNQGKSVDVLVALYCDDIKVFSNDDVYTLDITPSHDKFAAFIQAIFPDDKFIKKY